MKFYYFPDIRDLGKNKELILATDILIIGALILIFLKENYKKW